MHNADEPPSFSSLPVDILLNIFARVPKRNYPIICCVSKQLRNIVLSPDIQKTQSLLGKEDYLYICFIDETKIFKTRHWFSLRRIDKNNESENVFGSIDIPLLPDPFRYSSSVISVGTQIFFFPGSIFTSSSFRILDTESGRMSEGPHMRVNRSRNCVALVGEKIFVIGGNSVDEIPAEVFDLKSKSWEIAPSPKIDYKHRWISDAKVSIDGKVCAFNRLSGHMSCYNSRDGSCEILELPNDQWWNTGICVIENILYIYFSKFGLMWYDSPLLRWRVVDGLDLVDARCVGMAEFYGKLAFLWEKPSLGSSETKEIRCKLIGLLRSKVGICGTEEPSQISMIVPRGFKFNHCLSFFLKKRYIVD